MTNQKQDPKIEWGFYAITPRIVRTKYKNLSHAAKWLYVCLKDLCGEKGTCYRTLRVLSEETDLSIASLSTMIRELHDAGLIHAEKKRRSNNPTAKEVWHITIVDIWQNNVEYCSSAEQKRSNTEHSEENVQETNNNVQNMNEPPIERSSAEQKRSNFRNRSNNIEERTSIEDITLEERESTAPESDTPPVSPPSVGDSRAEPFFDQCFFCQDTMRTRCVMCGKRICEKHSRNMKGGDIWCEACHYYFEVYTAQQFAFSPVGADAPLPPRSIYRDEEDEQEQRETWQALQAGLIESGVLPPSDNETQQQIEHTHEGIEHPFTCYYEGQYYAACPLQETEARLPAVSKKGRDDDGHRRGVEQNTPTTPPAQATPPQPEQAAPGMTFVEARDYLRSLGYFLEPTPSRNGNWEIREPGENGFGVIKGDEVRRIADYQREKRQSAQQNHSADTPCGTVVTPGAPPPGVPPKQQTLQAPEKRQSAKREKKAEPAPKCDTKEIQRRIDEHRGYSLEERVEIIRERQAIKTWCNLHTLEEYGTVMQGLKRDPYWGKPENYYRIGGLTLLKETSRILAAAATQYKPALRIVPTSEQPTVSGRPRLDVPPEYLAMMMGARS